jgi:hypothetical protein
MAMVDEVLAPATVDADPLAVLTVVGVTPAGLVDP